MIGVRGPRLVSVSFRFFCLFCLLLLGVEL